MQDQTLSNGVPSQETAGTPSRIDTPVTRRAAADLEWQHVLEQVAAFAAGPLGAAHAIEGTGQRDHSYGVRDMRAPTSWRWISFQLGETFAVNATKVRVLALEAASGYAFDEGVAEPLRGFRTSADADEDGRWPASFTLELDRAKDTLAIDVRVLRQLPIFVDTDGHGSVVNEALAEFSFRGRRALGIVEAMSQRGP